jgi:hypothetical protein
MAGLTVDPPRSLQLSPAPQAMRPGMNGLQLVWLKSSRGRLPHTNEAIGEPLGGPHSLPFQSQLLLIQLHRDMKCSDSNI